MRLPNEPLDSHEARVKQAYERPCLRGYMRIGSIQSSTTTPRIAFILRPTKDCVVGAQVALSRGQLSQGAVIDRNRHLTPRNGDHASESCCKAMRYRELLLQDHEFSGSIPTNATRRYRSL